MNARQEAIQLIDTLSEVQIIKVVDFIRIIREQKEENRLTDGRKELLDLLNFTVDTGRGDFAEKHDHYIYGAK